MDNDDFSPLFAVFISQWIVSSVQLATYSNTLSN